MKRIRANSIGNGVLPSAKRICTASNGESGNSDEKNSSSSASSAALSAPGLLPQVNITNISAEIAADFAPIELKRRGSTVDDMEDVVTQAEEPVCAGLPALQSTSAAGIPSSSAVARIEEAVHSACRISKAAPLVLQRQGAFAPFSSLTDACWTKIIAKHGLSRAAIDDIAAMVSVEDFDVAALARNGKAMERARERLPTLTVYEHKLPERDGFSPSVFHVDFLQVLQRMLTTPSIVAGLIQEPRKVQLPSEVYHGSLVRESALFGFDSVCVAGTRIRLGADIGLKDGRVGQLAAIALHEHSADFVLEVRLYDEGKARELTLTDSRHDCALSDIAGTVLVCSKSKFDALSRADRRTAYWCEFYRDSERTRTVVAAAPQLPSRQFSPPPDPPAGAKVVKLCVDLYCDFYPTLSRNQHSVGGVYVQLLNSPHADRQSVSSIQQICLIPPEGRFAESVGCIAESIKRLQNGLWMMVGNERCWVVGGLGLLSGDFPQLNECACVKGPTALRFCRACTAHRSDISNAQFDVEANQRVLAVQNAMIRRIRTTREPAEQASLSKTTGLKPEASPVQQLKIDVFRQTPYDAFHQLVAGLGKRLLSALVLSLSSAALAELSRRLRAFLLPANWGSFRSLDERAGWSLQDIQHFFLIAPLLLRGFLVEERLTRTAKEWLAAGAASARLDCGAVLYRNICNLSKLMSLVFAPIGRPDAIATASREMVRFSSTLGETLEQPNLHCVLHQATAVQMYGAAPNYDVRAKERRHKKAKAFVGNLNFHRMERDLMVRDQQDAALQYMLSGGTLAPCGDGLKTAVASSPQLQTLFGSSIDADVEMLPSVIDTAAAVADGSDAKDGKDAAPAAGSLPALAQDFKFRRVEDPAPLSAADGDELRQAYRLSYSLNFEALEHAQHQQLGQLDLVGASSTLVLTAGDFVEVQLPQGEAFARVDAIFKHVANDNRTFVWLKLTWLVSSDNDAATSCPRFKPSLVDRARNRRTRFQPPGVVLRAVHMVHCCRFEGDRGSAAMCALDSSSNSNRRLGVQHADRPEFLLNTFYHRIYGLSSDIERLRRAS